MNLFNLMAKTEASFKDKFDFITSDFESLNISVTSYIFLSEKLFPLIFLSFNSSLIDFIILCRLISASIIFGINFKFCAPFISTLAPPSIETFKSCLIVPNPLFVSGKLLK